MRPTPKAHLSAKRSNSCDHWHVTRDGIGRETRIKIEDGVVRRVIGGDVHRVEDANRVLLVLGARDRERVRPSDRDEHDREYGASCHPASPIRTSISPSNLALARSSHQSRSCLQRGSAGWFDPRRNSFTSTVSRAVRRAESTVLSESPPGSVRFRTEWSHRRTSARLVGNAATGAKRLLSAGSGGPLDWHHACHGSGRWNTQIGPKKSASIGMFGWHVRELCARLQRT